MASLPYPLLNFAFRSIFLAIIFWIGLCCFSEVSAGGYGGELLGKGGHKQREFDLFKLALQWPGTYCRKSRKCCSSNGCCRGSNGPSGFTIHGLWPDYNDGSYPSCCSGKRFDSKEVTWLCRLKMHLVGNVNYLSRTVWDAPFKEKNLIKISTLSDALNTYWPSLSCGSPSNCHGKKGSFWEHEWEKHGTCASAVTGEEYNYFLTALNLYFKYNVTDVLRESGYVASNSEKYPVGGIIEAIQNAFHATPEIECSNGAIEELYLCFYKDLTPRDCESGAKTSCPTYVSLPEYASLNLGSDETEAWSI